MCKDSEDDILVFRSGSPESPSHPTPTQSIPPSPVHPLLTEMGLTWLMQASLMISEPGSAEKRETRVTLDNVKIHRRNKNQS